MATSEEGFDLTAQMSQLDKRLLALKEENETLVGDIAIVMGFLMFKTKYAVHYCVLPFALTVGIILSI